MSLAGLRVLVAEDEALVADVLCDMVEALGGTVAATAACLAEAEGLAEWVSVDVAILDVNLAGRMSYPAAERLLARGVPLLFVTGYAAEALPNALRGAPVVAKPYSMADIAAGTHRALGSQGAAA